MKHSQTLFALLLAIVFFSVALPVSAALNPPASPTYQGKPIDICWADTIDSNGQIIHKDCFANLAETASWICNNWFGSAGGALSYTYQQGGAREYGGTIYAPTSDTSSTGDWYFTSIQCSGGTTSQTVKCYDNNDCPAEQNVGVPFCQTGATEGITQNVRTYDCINPGTSNAYCKSRIVGELTACVSGQTCQVQSDQSVKCAADLNSCAGKTCVAPMGVCSNGKCVECVQKSDCLKQSLMGVFSYCDLKNWIWEKSTDVKCVQNKCVASLVQEKVTDCNIGNRICKDDGEGEAYCDSCKPEGKKDCYIKDGAWWVRWLDSCNKWGKFVQMCLEDEVCKNAECVKRDGYCETVEDCPGRGEFKSVSQICDPGPDGLQTHQYYRQYTSYRCVANACTKFVEAEKNQYGEIIYDYCGEREICNGDRCVPIKCVTNAHCGPFPFNPNEQAPGEKIGGPICEVANLTPMYAEVNVIQKSRYDICDNAESLLASCGSIFESVTVSRCDKGVCRNGGCQEQTCSDNTECAKFGSGEFIGPTWCNTENQVYQAFMEPTCVATSFNGGSGACMDWKNTDGKVKEDCGRDKKCYFGACETVQMHFSCNRVTKQCRQLPGVGMNEVSCESICK